MTLTTADRIKTAYTLLPPPLAALPAKYWTPISLLIHSYSVATLFQELVDAYSRAYDAGDAPAPENAFIIGFIHDFGQKLGLNSRKLDKIQEWVAKRLQNLGYTEHEARSLAKYVGTNPAETRSDPSYPRWVWELLRLADRLQGSSNIGDLMASVNEAANRLERHYYLSFYNVASPHMFLRTAIARVLLKHVKKESIGEPGSLIVPIGTSNGVIIMSDTPLGDAIFGWDEMRKILEDEFLIPEAEAELFAKSAIYCESGSGEQPMGFKKKYCDKLGRLRLGTYHTLILYYGSRELAEELIPNTKPVLPTGFKDMLLGIRFNDVEFGDSPYTCPLCGIKTPHGVHLSMISDLLGRNVAKEKWSRRYPPVNLNILLRSPREYLVCPICLGDTILYHRLMSEAPRGKGRNRKNVLFTMTFSATMPITASEDLGMLLRYLLENSYDKSVALDTKLLPLLSVEMLPDTLPEASLAFDPFTTSLYGVVTVWGEGFEPTARITTMAGLLASWGLYPIIASYAQPSAPTRKLFLSPDGQRDMYDFDPSDRRDGRYTPYVASLLLAFGHLYNRKYNVNEPVPAVTEILDYTPNHAPHLLQYASPRLYSHLESLRIELEG